MSWYARKFEFWLKLNEYWDDFSWGWESFNPNWNPNIWDWYNLWVNSVKTSFWLSSALPWHEVMIWVVSWMIEEQAVSWNYRYHIDFRRDWVIVPWREWNYYYDPDNSWTWWWYSAWVWFWYASWEIRNNTIDESFSCYIACYRPNWSKIFDEEKYFTITWVDQEKMEDHGSWYMWVDWSKLCFTCWNWFTQEIWGEQVKIVWSQYTWCIWYDPNDLNRLQYIDEIWNHKRTHQGYTTDDWRWWLGNWRYVGTQYAWRIYMNWDWHTTYIYFVNNDWYMVRLWNSYVTIY